MRKFHSIFIIVIGIAVGWSCQPDPLKDLSVEDSNVFITNFDKNANFGNYRTYSIADSVYILQNQRSGISNNPRDMVLHSEVIKNLNQRGFIRIDRSAKPDIGVNVIRVSETQSGVIPNQNPWLWNSYWGGGFGGGFGPGYFYPPTYTYYQTTETYWHIEIIDLKNLTQNQQAPIVWNAQIRGNGIFDETSMANMVKSVFDQSPYLKKQ